MGKDEVTIRFKPTAQDYKRVLIRSSLRVLAPIFAVVLTIVSSCVCTLAGSKPTDPGNDKRIVIIPAILLLPVVVLGLIYWGISKQANKLEQLAEETQFTFSEAGIKSSNASASAEVKWERYVKILETNTDFVIYPQQNLVVPIPKAAFESDVQIELFRSLVASKLGGKAKLKG